MTRSLQNVIKLAQQAKETVITMPYRRWLANGGAERPLPGWVVDRIAAELAKVPRVRHSSFASSEAGRCLRRQELKFMGDHQIAELLGLEVQEGPAEDPELLNIYNDGKWRHLRWQANLLTAGIVNDIEFGLPWPHMRSVGTVDAVGVVENDHPNPDWRGLEFGLELKGMNEWPYRKLTEADDQKEEHKGQFGRYFLSGGFDLFIVLYENKNVNNWTEWVFSRDQVDLVASRMELEALNRAVDEDRLDRPLASCTARMGKAWDNCPFAGRGGICERMP